MFTGIIKQTAKVINILKEGSNIHFTFESEMAKELSVDESVAHSGVCLTVVEANDFSYIVTAVQETLSKTNLGDLIIGSEVNLERAMVYNARLDGHIVQGHVDLTGSCIEINDVDGSWIFTFRYKPSDVHLLVDKGSVCVNGTSLTVVNPHDDVFSVAVIPYTFNNTVFRNMKAGDRVNLEFDVIGKYIARYAKLYAGKF